MRTSSTPSRSTCRGQSSTAPGSEGRSELLSTLRNHGTNLLVDTRQSRDARQLRRRSRPPRTRRFPCRRDEVPFRLGQRHAEPRIDGSHCAQLSKRCRIPTPVEDEKGAAARLVKLEPGSERGQPAERSSPMYSFASAKNSDTNGHWLSSPALGDCANRAMSSGVLAKLHAE